MATIGLALVLLALQYGVIVHFRLLSRLLVCASLILLSVGVWMFVTGSTYRRGANAPRWWRIGYFCFAALGLGVGFYVVTLIS